MTKLYTVGQSKARHWRTCRQAYHYKYEEQLIPSRTKRPFAFGKIIHRMLEAEAEEEDPFAVLNEIAGDVDNAKIFAGEKELYGDIVEDIRTIMADYFDYWPANSLRLIGVKDPETKEIRFSEHEFAIPLDDLAPKRRRRDVEGIVFKGQVDSLAKTPNKLRWLGEHKTFDKLPSDDERWRNLQSVVYIRAVKYLGWMSQIDGVAWNYVMSKAPTVPQVLKSGERLSVREIVTLPSVVHRALKEHNLKAEDHEELLRRAEESRSTYFRRIFTPLNQTVADQIFDGFLDTACEMRDNHGRRKDKNIGRHCGWCDYETLCRAEFTGGDLDFSKSHDYVKEDPEAYHRSGRGKRSDRLKIVG